MASPCGHYESARHSGLSHPDQRGSPGQENRLLEHETRRLTEELHTRTGVEPGGEKFPSCSSICISTQTTNMQWFYQHTHSTLFFFKSIRYIYSTRIRYKLIWIASRLHSRFYSLSRLFSKSVFPCFRTGQIQIWDQVTMRLLERFSLKKIRWAQLFVGATLYGEDFGHGTIATRGCIPSWTDPRRTTPTIKSSFRPSRTT